MVEDRIRPGGRAAAPAFEPDPVDRTEIARGAGGSSVPTSDSDVDPWAWVSASEESTPQIDLSHCQVTAVLVAVNAADWLPDTLAGLAGLTCRPTRLIAIDNGSDDSTSVLLAQAEASGLLDAVYAGTPGTGFGHGVAAALRRDASVGGQDLSPSHWLWLLHDDAVPAPDALEHLLRHVLRADPPLDLTGPKLLQPPRRRQRRQLSEVGASISGTGRRDLGLEPGEIDQGQRDEPAEVLGVSTCGLLIRAAVWSELGGLDPALPAFRDGVEFGWRARLAGHRVATTPSAEFVHRQVGRAGLRAGGAAGTRPEKLDRELGMLVVAGHARRSQLPVVMVRLVASALVNALGFLLGKVPGRARDELLALGAVLARPGRIRALRARVREHRSVPGGAAAVARLRPPWWAGLRLAAEASSGALSRRYRAVAGEAETTSLDELTGDDFAVVGEDRRASAWFAPIVVTVAAAAIGSLIAARTLFASGHLVAPALLPAPDRLGDLWAAASTPIPGAPEQVAPPWLAAVSLAATVLAGRPEWVVTLLLCATVPLALISAYPVLQRLVADRRVRLWAGATYALVPVLLGGTNQGRLALSVTALMLPLLAGSARAIAARRPRAPEATRGGWAAGLVLVVLGAFEPFVLVIVAVLGATGAVALRRSPRKIGRIGIALSVPAVGLVSWWPSLVAAPGRLFSGPDAALGGVDAAPTVWRLMLGQDLGPGRPPPWLAVVVFGCVWVVALAGLLRRGDTRLVRAAWGVALIAFASATVLSRLVVTVPPAGLEVRPWVGTYVLIGFGALLVAGAVGLDGLEAAVRRQSFSWRQPGAVLAGGALALVTGLGAGWWVWEGAAGPVGRTRLDGIPPYVLKAMTEEPRARVLAVDLSGSPARYAVLADDQARLGDADRGYAFGGSPTAPAAVGDLVVRLVAGAADADIAPALREYGVGYVWVRGASEEDSARIDNTPGLGPASGQDSAVIWQLIPPASRAMVVDPAARGRAVEEPVAPGTQILAGTETRELRLGEAADPRWTAELNGRALRATIGGWQQTYALPAEGGTVDYRLRSASWGWLVGQGMFLTVVGVLAAPAIRRPEVRDPTRTARRAAAVGGWHE